MNRIFTAISDVLKGKPFKLRSSRWESVRREFLKTNCSCRACGSTSHLQVHHKKPFHSHPELELDAANLITLCEDPKGSECHLKVGHLGNWKSINDNVEADAKEALAMKKVRSSINFGPNLI